MKVLLDPGCLDPEVLNSSLNLTHDFHYLINQNKANLYPSRSIFYEDIFSRKIQSHISHSFDLHNLINFLFSDPTPFYLAERTRSNNLSSSFLDSIRITELALSSYNFFITYQPTHIVFMATPHCIESWIFAKTLEYFCVNIIYFSKSLLPWRFIAHLGLARSHNYLLPSITNHTPICAKERDYIKTSLSHTRSTKPIPSYELSRFKSDGKYFSFLDELFSFNRVDLSLNKINCYNHYVNLSKSNINYSPSKYVFFPLHFQPERTTLPEGYEFAQQYQAIVLLRSALPKDIVVVVKEHPSTFTRLCHWKARSPQFYDAISNLDGCVLAPLDIDSYYLLDNALCTASISGNLSYESLIRGRASLTFGMSRVPFLSLPSYHRYSNPDSLHLFLDQLINGIPLNADSLIDRYLNKIHLFTYRHSEPNMLTDHTALNAQEVRVQALSDIVPRVVNYLLL